MKVEIYHLTVALVICRLAPQSRHGQKMLRVRLGKKILVENGLGGDPRETQRNLYCSMRKFLETFQSTPPVAFGRHQSFLSTAELLR